MTHEERSVFLYRFIFKISNEETAKRLKLSIRRVRKVTSTVNPDLAKCQKEVLESFGV